ncbi:putative isocitrate dehydrogenase [Leptomonas pyrrhocoris]|uniref:Isocitrate dehydrogenase [NADP] n=1 Tax=Leptomonas pyrrhocoris TaxID=157538 RepID=A0A0M9G2I7_LEPPY|nr:putative isocitrate dehydrogenase [Leptomonas pyrrhocoris]KPA81045.1 putative isocitrate dehydrogenase [Leptomonas pyrrhocoris]|eukprot:XP_015659484.1 putative isocitrate dehydrogenase [Leptomonas pyrrhocoris]
MADIITFSDGKLAVPSHPTIPYIEGDGIGKEITAAARRIFDAAVVKAYGDARKVSWMEVLAGQKAFDAKGTWLPDETIESFGKYRVGLKGPLTTPVGEGIRSLNVVLRRRLDLFVCVRPVRWFTGVGSPMKHPEWVDMVVFRENTEDIYSGIEWAQGSPEAQKFTQFLVKEMGVKEVRFPATSAYGVKPVSVEGSERLVRAAIQFAVDHHLPSVTLVHKGNIMKFTEGGFKKWGYALAEREFADAVFTATQYDALKEKSGKEAADAAMRAATDSGKVIIKDCICDAFLQNTVLRPLDYSVIATMNLNGDYISDQLAALVGGIGISPGGNINYTTGHAIFEATHGTAPDIAGQGTANPSSLILSGAMMFDYMGWSEVFAHIINAMEMVFQSNMATGDLTRQMQGAKTLSTEEFADAIIKKINGDGA